MRTGIFVVGILGNNGSLLAAHASLSDRKPLPGSIVTNGTDRRTGQSISERVPDPGFIPVRGWDIRHVSSWRKCLEDNGVVKGEHLKRCVDALNNAAVKSLRGVCLPGYVHLREPVMDDCKDDPNTTLNRLVNDVDSFANEFGLEHVVVIYSGSTERTVEWDWSDKSSWPPSVYYAAAACEAKTQCSFANCAAQVSTSPAMMQTFDSRGRVCIGNHDLSTGQTKTKKAILDFLLSAGFPLTHVVSRNELGNRDGYNLRDAATNSSKITTKSSMLDACLAARPGVIHDSAVEHSVRIDYCEAIGDDKLATDEFGFRLGYGERTVMSIRTVCKDTLLAVPLLWDLCILLPMMANVTDSRGASGILAYYFKALPCGEASPFLLEQLDFLTTWIYNQTY